MDALGQADTIVAMKRSFLPAGRRSVSILLLMLALVAGATGSPTLADADRGIGSVPVATESTAAHAAGWRKRWKLKLEVLRFNATAWETNLRDSRSRFYKTVLPLCRAAQEDPANWPAVEQTAKLEYSLSKQLSNFGLSTTGAGEALRNFSTKFKPRKQKKLDELVGELRDLYRTIDQQYVERLQAALSAVTDRDCAAASTRMADSEALIRDTMDTLDAIIRDLRDL